MPGASRTRRVDEIARTRLASRRATTSRRARRARGCAHFSLSNTKRRASCGVPITNSPPSNAMSRGGPRLAARRPRDVDRRRRQPERLQRHEQRLAVHVLVQQRELRRSSAPPRGVRASASSVASSVSRHVARAGARAGGYGRCQRVSCGTALESKSASAPSSSEDARPVARRRVAQAPVLLEPRDVRRAPTAADSRSAMHGTCERIEVEVAVDRERARARIAQRRARGGRLRIIAPMGSPAKPVVCIVTPGTRSANNGNWRTAARWARMLRDRYKVIVQTRVGRRARATR